MAHSIKDVLLEHYFSILADRQHLDDFRLREILRKIPSSIEPKRLSGLAPLFLEITNSAAGTNFRVVGRCSVTGFYLTCAIQRCTKNWRLT